ncbi:MULTISPECIES: hypothetical protein [Weissella]|uniref:Uncharacterized protein n=1 Tax=Weissella thailandensis TaxID=89061 RepID=A0ABX9I9Y9_9LACO|nr:hypothetical protein [Weissella thailandensis]NKY90234.1 hypothetical protein [Weissella thailandensis]RDS60309.1 hypothetical protein DWV05_01815 [Weissella thailandensis]GEP74030.1 hypothetical protein WTH01_02770 [Weissella thailandensis]
MSNTTIQGKLVQVARGNGLYMLSVETGRADGLLVLPATAEQYHLLFPAGDPVLNDHYEITFKQTPEQIKLLSVFDLADEVVPAELVPTLITTQDFDLQGEEFMDTKKEAAALEKRLAAIRQDESLMQDIQAEVDQEEQQRLANIKARQEGQGIEQLFTEEEIANMNAYKPKTQPQGASLSARTQVATDANDLPMEGD